MAAFRKQRRDHGYRETMIWLHESVREQMDAAITAGRFNSRSDLMTAAVEELLKREVH